METEKGRTKSVGERNKEKRNFCVKILYLLGAIVAIVRVIFVIAHIIDETNSETTITTPAPTDEFEPYESDPKWAIVVYFILNGIKLIIYIFEACTGDCKYLRNWMMCVLCVGANWWMNKCCTTCYQKISGLVLLIFGLILSIVLQFFTWVIFKELRIPVEKVLSITATVIAGAVFLCKCWCSKKK
eukprot:116039_1